MKKVVAVALALISLACGGPTFTAYRPSPGTEGEILVMLDKVQCANAQIDESYCHPIVRDGLVSMTFQVLDITTNRALPLDFDEDDFVVLYGGQEGGNLMVNPLNEVHQAQLYVILVQNRLLDNVVVTGELKRTITERLTTEHIWVMVLDYGDDVKGLDGKHWEQAPIWQDSSLVRQALDDWQMPQQEEEENHYFKALQTMLSELDKGKIGEFRKMKNARVELVLVTDGFDSSVKTCKDVEPALAGLKEKFDEMRMHGLEERIRVHAIPIGKRANIDSSSCSAAADMQLSGISGYDASSLIKIAEYGGGSYQEWPPNGDVGMGLSETKRPFFTTFSIICEVSPELTEEATRVEIRTRPHLWLAAEGGVDVAF